MPITVQLPDGRSAEFPDGMSRQDIEAVLQKQFAAPAPVDPAASMKRNAQGSTLAALNGLTFGFADEIAGKVAGEGVRDEMRSRLDAYKAENPGRAMGSEVLGGLPIGGALGRVIPALKSLPRQMAAGGAVGGATGALTAAGEAKDTEGMYDAATTGGLIASGVGAGLPPAARGAGMIGSQLLSKYLPEASQRWGAEKIAQAFARDGMDGQQAAARMAQLGPEARVVDAGKESVRQRLDDLATAPGSTKTAVESAIESRQASRGTRMREAADEAFDANGRRLVGDGGQFGIWEQQRLKAATPLYNRLHSMNVPNDVGLDRVVRIAAGQGLDARARKFAELKDVPFTLEPGAQSFSMRDLDFLKRALDDEIIDAKPNGKPTAMSNALGDLRKSLVDNLDTSTKGLYKRARDAWSGTKQLEDAANEGRNAIRLDDTAISDIKRGMSQSELDAFSLGAYEAMRAKVGAQAGQTEMMKLWRQDNMKERLTAIFGDAEKFRKFAQRMDAERQMGKLESVGRGSQTAARLAGQADLAEPVMGMATANSPVGYITGMRNLFGKMGTPEPVRDAMGQLMLSRDPQKLLELDPLIQQINQERTRQSVGLGLVGGLLLP